MGSARMEVKELLGLAYWMKGLRCFPWMAFVFFLKDDLAVSPSTLQLLKNSVDLPMVIKPIWGVVSDAVYICGGHRLPYIAIGVALQAITWFLIALLPKSFLTVSVFFILVLVSKLGASIAEVANAAMVAEAGKESQSPKHLQSFVSMFDSFGGILGNVLGGVLVNQLPSQTIFSFYALLLTFQFLITVVIPEQSLKLPQKKELPYHPITYRRGPRQQFILSNDVSDHSIRRSTSSTLTNISKQMHDLSYVLQRADIFYSICWLATSNALVPILSSIMLYYQTQHLNLNASVIAISKVFGQGFLFSWSVAYRKWLNKVPPRRLLSTIQGVMALSMVSDVLFVKGAYRAIGISDYIYVVVVSGLSRELGQFKMLPFNVLMAQLCPTGFEGSLMAFVTSVIALSNIISGYFGVTLAMLVGLSVDEHSNLIWGILIEATFTIIPLYWSSWVLEYGSKENKDK